MLEWDARKAAGNRLKNGVSFEEAATAFGALDGPDMRHSEKESRFLRLGRAATGRVLMVAYTARRQDDGERIRIISARRASRKERAAYAASSRIAIRIDPQVLDAVRREATRRGLGYQSLINNLLARYVGRARSA